MFPIDAFAIERKLPDDEPSLIRRSNNWLGDKYSSL